jgi:pSer/pThr/pTyr-binding forkhead associated (FHA) protein
MGGLTLFVLHGELYEEEKEGIVLNTKLTPTTVVARELDLITIGRGTANLLRTNAQSVSRAHCTLVKRNKQWFIKDHGAKYGTFITRENRFTVQLIDGEFPLEWGDILSLGGLDSAGILQLRFGGR